MTSIGTKIRKIREFKNLTQENMADELGISSVAYGKLERDETNFSKDKLEQIAKILGHTVQEILSFDEKNVIINNQGNNSGGSGSGTIFNNYNFPEEIKKLYEDNARLQEEKNKLLEEKIQWLEEKIDFLQKGK